MWSQLASLESYAFSINAVFVASSAIIILIISIFIRLHERASRAISIFQWIIFLDFIYYVGLTGNYLAKDVNLALWWQHVALLGLLLQPTAVYRFCAALNQGVRPHPFLMIVNDLICASLVILHLGMNLFLEEPYTYAWGYFMHWNSLTLVFGVYYSIVCIFGMSPFMATIRNPKASLTQRERARWLLIAWLISSGAFVDVFPAYGYQIYPAAYIFILLTMISTAMVTLRFRLVDITPAFAAQRIIDTMHDALLVTDTDRHVRLINQAACNLLGLKAEEILHHPVPTVLEQAVPLAVQEALQHGGDQQNLEIIYKHPAHEQAINLSLSISPMKNKRGSTEAYVALLRNISEQRAAEKKAYQLANYDPLTQLPNRNQLRDRLTKLVDEGARHNFDMAILLIDLDQFKRINDSFGHSIGDRLLREAAKRLRQCLWIRDNRHPDRFREMEATLARLGGDEFVIALHRIQDDLEVAQLARRIIQSFSQPIQLQDHEIYIGASVGISRFPQDAKDVESLLRNADTAMYHAKEQGRGTYQYFDEKMNSILQQRLVIEADLRKALLRNELVVYYQPQVNIQTGRIDGLEALIRWRHPERGLVSPAEFIPVAEDSGLIVPIGTFVMQTACKQVQAWHQAGYHPMRIAVNLSAKQFQQAGLIDTVTEVLAESALAPQYLELEITESILMQDAEDVASTLHAIRDLGVLLTIDDFGTGYSSLSYLKRFPITGVKIDHSFIRDVPHDPDDVSLTQAILAMARSLKLEVVPEGIENQEQLNFLQSNHQGLAQGYLFARPMPAAEIERYLQKDIVHEGAPLAELPALIVAERR
jgi:diguanylate cyclase (GGDEF)-like protein/PAS domain S-box-containing protein